MDDKHDEGMVKQLMSLADTVARADTALSLLRLIIGTVNAMLELELDKQDVLDSLMTLLPELLVANHDYYTDAFCEHDERLRAIVTRVTPEYTDTDGWDYRGLTEVVMMEFLLSEG